MKARRRTARWLLIALLFGFLAAAGLTIAHHHRLRTPAQPSDEASAAAPPGRTVVVPQVPLIASTASKHGHTAPAGTRHRRLTVSTSPNSRAPSMSGHPGPQSMTTAAGGRGWGNHIPLASGAPIAVTKPQSGGPVASRTNVPAPAGSGDFAYDGYVPLDCELPAGCGVAAAAGYVSRQSPGTSAGMPFVHDSQGSASGGGNSGFQMNGGGPQTNDTGQISDAPGQSLGQGSGTVAAAPELDPATWTGAATLLLGSLAILRGRRARAPC